MEEGHAIQWPKKDKRVSNDLHYTENSRLSNTNPQKSGVNSGAPEV
jgi:hypothetical protein